MNWVENSSEINAVSEAINHLEEQEEFYWTFRSRVRWLQTGDILTCLDPMVTADMNGNLCSPILDLEINDAVFNIGGTKVPGPDMF
ncbi:hypothetical protein ACFXTI_029442 [Malus domestica]